MYSLGKKKKKLSGLNLNFFDYPLFSLIMTLAIFSLIMLYSVTSITDAHFVKKQTLWVFIGFVFMVIVIFCDLEKIREYISFINIGVLFLLLITLFMPDVQNVKRWIPLGFMKLQTSELAKISLMLYLADHTDRNYSKLNTWAFYKKPLLIVVSTLVLIGLQPDLGTPALIFFICLAALFAGGVKLSHLTLPVIAFIPVVIIEFLRHPYRIKRLKTFLSPWETAQNETYQLAQSLIAIGSGGWFGVGLGASAIKLKYLPEAHTDFIFPIIAEELGFLGSLAIIMAFLTFLYRGLKIAKTSENMFLSLLTAGCSLMIGGQAFFNMAMTTGMIPTKGLPLPFFSYGGTSIVTTMILCGFILNSSRKRKTI